MIMIAVIQASNQKNQTTGTNVKSPVGTVCTLITFIFSAVKGLSVRNRQFNSAKAPPEQKPMVINCFFFKGEIQNATQEKQFVCFRSNLLWANRCCYATSSVPANPPVAAVLISSADDLQRQRDTG